VRLNWQLTLNSFIRLSSVYTQIERDPTLYLYQRPDKRYRDLGNELLYGYKLNPQSVFYVGYSDAFTANDDLDSLTQHEKTYFMKLSYAWLL
jgi:CRISPR/Cas system-associated protein Cas5 (RAMP superfamily)